MDLSVIIPVYNEKKNVFMLHNKIKTVLDQLGQSYDIIFIDDGSTDGTYQELRKLIPVKIIRFRKNFGQTAAMDAGFKHARGKIIITMDGDLQNDPVDIPRLLVKIREGYDVVSGWRYKRKDSPQKILFSKFADILRHLLINDNIHDSGCCLKAYRAECFNNLDLYGEMHRYIPALLRLRGFRVGEVKVRHYRRRFGKTKYSISRIFKGFLDLINVWFWMKFNGRPLHLFGGVGIIFSCAGIIGGTYALFEKLFFYKDLSSNFLAVASILIFVIGLQFLISGLMADILLRTFHKQHGGNYYIREIIEKKNVRLEQY